MPCIYITDESKLAIVFFAILSVASIARHCFRFSLPFSSFSSFVPFFIPRRFDSSPIYIAYIGGKRERSIELT